MGRKGQKGVANSCKQNSDCIFSPVQESVIAEKREPSVCVTSLMALEGGKKEQDLMTTNFFTEVRKAECSSFNDHRSYFKKPLGSHDARSQTRKQTGMLGQRGDAMI